MKSIAKVGFHVAVIWAGGFWISTPGGGQDPEEGLIMPQENQKIWEQPDKIPGIRTGIWCQQIIIFSIKWNWFQMRDR